MSQKQKKRLHELAKELDVTTDRLMDIALRLGMRFSSNFNAVEPEQEERLRLEVKGPLKKKKKPIVRIVKTAKQKAAEEAAEAAREAALEAGVDEEIAEAVAQETLQAQLEPEKGAEPEPAPEETAAEKPETEVPVEAAVEGQAAPAVVKAEEPATPLEGKEEAEPAAVEIEAPMAAVDVTEETAEKPAPVVEKAKEQVPEPVAAAPETSREEPKPERIEEIAPPPPRVIIRPAPPAHPAAVALDGEEPRKRKKRRRRRKDRVAAEVAAKRPDIIEGKKRSKRATQPKVDHVMLSEGMTLKELADKLGITAKDIIQKLLLERGIMANINLVLDIETAALIAESYGVTTEAMSYEEEVALVDELQVEGKAVTRAPVVTLMGHVDHGKTTLLDYIRRSDVVDGEFGGITQHIGAYKISRGERGIVFLDTPGHAAFTRLRARGAQVTDIVILIVAADDGVMPQTIEAIQHAKAAEVPIIVVITKTDLPRADVEKVKKGLAENNIQVESWGGDIVSVEVSGKTGAGVDDLLDIIDLVAEMRDLRAYPEIKGVGTVIEAQLDRAKGPVATVLIQNGTVRIGDFFIAGTAIGRIKAMIDENANRLDEVGPSTPVEILGFNEVPESGDQFQIVDDESKARQMVSYRIEKSRASQQAAGGPRMSLDDLFSRIEEGEVKELPLIIKGDVRGSVEALGDALNQLSTDAVKVDVKLAQPGAITESDVLLATASNAIIIGFNVRAQKSAARLAEKDGVEIRFYNIIYEVTKDVRDAMEGLLDPTFKEVIIGKAEVRQIFKVPKIGVVAGLYVTDGMLMRNAGVRVLRDDVVIHEGRVGSLRRFKEDVREVKNGFECGLGIENYKDLREGDVIEMFVKEEVAAKM